MVSQRHDLIRRAEALAARGKLRRALGLYLQVLKVEAEDEKLLNRAGDLCLRLQRDTEAITFYKRAASVLHGRGFYPRAAALCRKILKLDPRLLDVIEALAELLAKQGLAAEAVEQYEALAQYYRQPGQTARAIRILGRIVELRPASLPHRIELAALLGRQGRAAEAKEQYLAVASRELARGEAARAREALVRAFELAPDDLDLVAESIDRLRQAGFAQEAEKLLQAALELTPRTEALTQRLAAPPARPLANIRPRSSAPAAAAGTPAVGPPALPLSPPAVAAAEPVAPTPSPEADDLFVDLAAELQAELGADAPVRESDPPGSRTGPVREAIGDGLPPTADSEPLDPEEIETHFQLGVAYREMGLIDEAVGELQAAARHPDYLVRCSLHLADCFVDKGFPQLAVEWLERALALPSLSSDESDSLRRHLAKLELPVKEAQKTKAPTCDELELDLEMLGAPVKPTSSSPKPPTERQE